MHLLGCEGVKEYELKEYKLYRHTGFLALSVRGTGGELRQAYSERVKLQRKIVRRRLFLRQESHLLDHVCIICGTHVSHEAATGIAHDKFKFSRCQDCLRKKKGKEHYCSKCGKRQTLKEFMESRLEYANKKFKHLCAQGKQTPDAIKARVRLDLTISWLNTQSCDLCKDTKIPIDEAKFARLQETDQTLLDLIREYDQEGAFIETQKLSIP